jgi:hypothetical protein
MTHKLPIFTCLILWFATEPVWPAEPALNNESRPASQAALLLQNAINALEEHNCISAKVRHEVELFDKHLVGTGIYLEQHRGQDRLLRLELRTQLGEQVSSLVQVCDGRYLWKHLNMPDEVRLTRIDVAQVSRVLCEKGKMPQNAGNDILPSLGGMPKLLISLQSAFDFTVAEQGYWGKKKQPVWRLQGGWKQEEMLRLLPNQKSAIEKGDPPDLGKLPEYVPQQVVLLLGQDDLFPYRVEYRRGSPEKTGHASEPASKAMVTIDLFEVVINVPIDPAQFIYNPGETEFTDRTGEFLQTLGVK